MNNTQQEENILVDEEYEDYDDISYDSEFSIRDDAELDWHFKRLAQIDQKVAELNEYANAVMHYTRGKIEKLSQRRSNIEALMRIFVENSGKKSKKTLYGICQLREYDKFEYPADEILLEWCKKNLTKAIVIKEYVNKNVLKQHVKETGEIPDGIEIIKTSSFTAKPSNDVLQSLKKIS